MAGSRLPGGPPCAARLLHPRVAGLVLAAAALLLSSLRLPASDRAVTEGAPPDSVVIQVEPAFRAEFDPFVGGAAVRRSHIYRIHVSVWSTTPPNQMTLVVGSEPDDPTTLGPMVRAQLADTLPLIRAPHRSPGDPAWQDASGWSAWKVPLVPSPRGLMDGNVHRPGGTDPRQPVYGAISLDSAAVATLGPWIGLFNDDGRRLATGHVRQVAR